MWGASREQNTWSQRKTPLILSSSYKCKNRRLRKGKGLVFSLADSNCLLRKVVYCMLFHGHSCYLAPIRMCLHFKDRRENSHHAQGAAWSSGQQCDVAECSSQVKAFSRASKCLAVLLFRHKAVAQRLYLPWALCS